MLGTWITADLNPVSDDRHSDRRRDRMHWSAWELNSRSSYAHRHPPHSIGIERYGVIVVSWRRTIWYAIHSMDEFGRSLVQCSSVYTHLLLSSICSNRRRPNLKKKLSWRQTSTFLPRYAMHTADYDVRLSVRPSVCHMPVFCRNS